MPAIHSIDVPIFKKNQRRLYRIIYPTTISDRSPEKEQKNTMVQFNQMKQSFERSNPSLHLFSFYHKLKTKRKHIFWTQWNLDNEQN